MLVSAFADQISPLTFTCPVASKGLISEITIPVFPIILETFVGVAFSLSTNFVKKVFVKGISMLDVITKTAV